jgi:hypothetical protein
MIAKLIWAVVLLCLSDHCQTVFWVAMEPKPRISILGMFRPAVGPEPLAGWVDDYPWQARLNTPVGQVQVVLWGHADLCQLVDVFCARAFGSGDAEVVVEVGARIVAPASLCSRSSAHRPRTPTLAPGSRSGWALLSTGRASGMEAWGGQAHPGWKPLGLLGGLRYGDEKRHGPSRGQTRRRWPIRVLTGVGRSGPRVGPPAA